MRSGTPAPIIPKLHDAVVATIDSASVQAYLIGISVAVVAPERRSAEFLKSSWQVKSRIGSPCQVKLPELGLRDEQVKPQ
jgi:hypothetical protein